MTELKIDGITKYNKVLECMPDKSVTHRAIMFNALAKGRAAVDNPLRSADTLSTLDCMLKLGASIEDDGTRLIVCGGNLHSANMYVGNSGTTVRLLSGLVSGLDGEFAFDGDDMIRRRPMNRVIKPLESMGAKITSNNGYCPFTVTGGSLRGIRYEMPVASAQVKSAIILAALNADGTTEIIEKVKSRDHTERMISRMGANIVTDGNVIQVRRSQLQSTDIYVVGDVSSAAFPLILAAAVGGEATVKRVGTNPTRFGLFNALMQMGATIDFENEVDGVEPYADVHISAAKLKPFIITESDVPSLVDEIPALCVLACFAEGKSVLSGASELRVKECDRIKAMVTNLTALGANVTETQDGMIIEGGTPLKYGVVDSFGDHRVAMAMAIAGRAASGVTILNPDCAVVSYPNFYNTVL